MLNKSVEEQIEDFIKLQLKDLGIKYYCKNQPINNEIDFALKTFPSKNFGKGGCYPDIKLLIDNIPVMIEVKGRFEDLIKKNIGLNGLELDMSSTSITKYAINGCCHYCQAILTYSHYDFCIGIGVAGNMINGKVNLNTNIWSLLINRENTFFIKKYSNLNDLSYLSNLKYNIDNLNSFELKKVIYGK